MAGKRKKSEAPAERETPVVTTESEPGPAAAENGAEAEDQILDEDDTEPNELSEDWVEEELADGGRRVTTRSVRRTSRRVEETTDEDVEETVTETFPATAGMPVPYRPPLAGEHPVPVG